ncbi:MAG: type II CRISPR RNA-guided endonuclease Cas9 [Gallionella sp.]|nr:type II CRISPR RNA-guided endonuclease Cas9 [Gallionella sp.]MDD4957704.1 type II CRISPR RNA-guided endonuclease Cas9 [Gallionella sp.]
MASRMRYRLALDLGSTSLGWAMLRLNADNQPCAIIKAGVRIFSDGRDAKTQASLAVARREARAMRRRRDRLLKRKARMMRTLIQYGFFPEDADERKALEGLNPFTLRAKGLDTALTPAEFARALFHINQRRGFKSNRKTDKNEADSGALKTAIQKVRDHIGAENCRTVGEWLHKRDTAGSTVRARYHADKVVGENGKSKLNKYYDLYIDRAMIEQEFDALWATQAALNPALFSEAARADLKDVLLYQRKLKPVQAGRCTFLPEEERAPLALPSTQRFRMYQEVNNLRLLGEGLKEQPLTLQQRDDLIAELEKKSKLTFTQIKKLLGVGGAVQFNLEDPKREDMKGNTTSAILGGAKCFGAAWFEFNEAQQDEIVLKLVQEENEAALIRWLQAETGIDERRAEIIANTGLPEGYGSLSAKALALILPELRREVITYDKAAKAAGFHHSQFENGAIDGRTFAVERVLTETGEIKTVHLHHELPYYGEFLQRHVGFGTGKPEDVPEKRYGKIANPTVHIGLNQVRCVVNALIKRYGHPSEIIVELARDLKQNKEQREEENKQQAKNQDRNKRLRKDIASTLQISEERVRRADIEKMILWEELSHNIADRCCPYSGAQIGAAMLLSDAVEIEHILPFSQTLDDSLNNKTVSMRQANRIKGNRTPWEARQDFDAQGWDYPSILARAENMAKNKRYRFGEDGYQKWLKDDKGFLPRALNDTRHLSKVAFEYLKLICPDTRVIPGRMTAMLRAKFGLNDVLGLNGEKNRNDHRHHAVDACVIAVTDQGMLQRFANASASARERQLNRLVETMPLPWETYREHVQRAIAAIWVSHKPDHGYEGAMHNDTAYGLRGEGQVSFHKMVEGERTHIIDNLKVIPMTHPHPRYGILANGEPKPYKGYKGDSNYCIEIVRNEKGKWEGEVISTFEAYQLVRQYKNPKDGVARLRHPTLSVSGKVLVMRLMIDDIVRLDVKGGLRTMRVATLSGNGQVFMADTSEANVDSRNRSKDDSFGYVSKMAGSLQSAKARRVTISPIGELRDPKFKG